MLGLLIQKCVIIFIMKKTCFFFPRRNQIVLIFIAFDLKPLCNANNISASFLKSVPS